MNATKNHAHNAVQMVVVNDHRFAVEERNGGISFNLSQMAKPYGKEKRPGSWLRTEESKTYIDAVSETLKCATADLVEVRQGGTPQNQGTWTTDYRIAVRFAQWLDVNFAIAVDELIYKMLTKKAQVIEPFAGVWPLVIDGVAIYNYTEVLKALGHSTTSGSVARRKKKFPQQFTMHFNRNFITLDFCRYLKALSAIKEIQMELDFNQKIEAK